MTCSDRTGETLLDDIRRVLSYATYCGVREYHHNKQHRRRHSTGHRMSSDPLTVTLFPKTLHRNVGASAVEASIQPRPFANGKLIFERMSGIQEDA